MTVEITPEEQEALIWLLRRVNTSARVYEAVKYTINTQAMEKKAVHLLSVFNKLNNPK